MLTYAYGWEENAQHFPITHRPRPIRLLPRCPLPLSRSHPLGSPHCCAASRHARCSSRLVEVALNGLAHLLTGRLSGNALANAGARMAAGCRRKGADRLDFVRAIVGSAE